jgi:hypothetical protein
MNGKIDNSMLFAALMLAKDQLTAITWMIAYRLGLKAVRFTEMASDVAMFIESCETPKIFWESFASHVAQLHLNDNESMVYGLLAASFLSDFEGSVVYGRQLAELNSIDFDKFVVEFEKETGVLYHAVGARLERKGH